MESGPIFNRIFQQLTVLAWASASFVSTWTEDGRACIDGVHMHFQPAGGEGDEECLLYVDFGKLPTEDSRAFLRKLLDSNFKASASNSRLYCLAPNNTQVLGFRRIPLRETSSATALFSLMYAEAAAAKAWPNIWPEDALSAQANSQAHFLKV